MKYYFLRFRKPLLLTTGAVILFLLWHIAAAAFDIPLILPKPLPVLKALGQLLGTAVFWKSVGLSVLRISLGAAAGLIIGFLAGILSAASDTARTLLSPLFSVIRATPVACFIILAWVFIGSAKLPVFIAALMVAPVMMTGTLTGLKSTDGALLEAAHLYRLTFFQRVRTCYLPALLPHAAAALVNCIGLAWKAGIAAEIIVKTKDSIGYAIWDAKSWNIDSTLLFAWTLAVIFISLLFEYLFRLLLKLGKESGNVA